VSYLWILHIPYGKFFGRCSEPCLMVDGVLERVTLGE